MSGFNVNDFKAEVGKTGFLQTNKYLIAFNTPPMMANAKINGKDSTSTEKMIQLRTESVRLPGVALTMGDVNRYGVGPVQKMPFNASFTTNSITFIADRKGDIYKYFYTWVNAIFDFGGRVGTSNIGASYKTEYKDNYTTDLHVYVYDNYGREVKHVVMYKAFPESLNEVSLGWNQVNELMKITVNFSFRDWAMVGVENTIPNRVGNNNVTTFIGSGNQSQIYQIPINTANGATSSSPKSTGTESTKSSAGTFGI